MEFDFIDHAVLLDTLHAGVVIHKADTSIAYANPRALEMLRLSAEQAVGKDAVDPEWRFLDEHKHPLPADHYPVNRVLADRKPVTNQTVGIVDSQREQITWVLVNAYPEFGPGQEIARVVVTFIDVTLEKTDIPFENIVARANDAVIVTEAYPLIDEGPRIVYVNDAFSDITGYAADEVIGKTPRILQGEDTDPATRQRIHEALDRGEVSREEILNYTKDGRPYWLDLNIVPFRNALGEIVYFAAIERDVTHSKDQESALRHLAEKEAALAQTLRYEVDVKNRFLSIIAHDLKGPFNGLLGLTEVLASMAGKFTREQIADYAVGVNESGRRVFDLLQNLLEWSRLQIEDGASQPEPFVVTGLVQECVDILQPVADEKGIALVNDADGSMAFADPEMCKTVVRNLTANALKFTDTGGSVVLSAETLGSEVRVAVKDTGVGMSAEQIEKIFAIDQRTSTDGTAGEKGTGLGLPLCKEMIDRIGGTIRVESQRGAGTTFFFTLPAASDSTR